jgi:hypothetical protein
MVDNAESSLFIPTVALAVSTAILVVVTAYYAKQTRNTVMEMKRATESQFLPRLIVTFNGVITRSGKLTFNIQNVGRGPALEIRMKISVNEKSTITEELNINVLEAASNIPFDFSAGFSPTSNIDATQEAIEYYKKNQTAVNVALNYKDIFDNDYEKSHSIDIKGL